MHTTKLILIRHGESSWNKENKFTGWQDVKLTKKGEEEALNASRLLRENDFYFHLAFTSVLQRAIHSLWIILYNLNQSWIPVTKAWQLNERHYGALQGLNKSEISIKYGKDIVYQWRRSFNTKPPAINWSNKYFPGNDKKYLNINPKLLPVTESLKCTVNRVIPYWNKFIFTEIKNKKNIIITAHGNSLRALIKYLDNINDEDISVLNIPTGKPILYEFNSKLQHSKHCFL
ncbi:2,3-diphosphoglycerate-dependent phosphoglycerate mutase [Buchnera aphidicola (Hormaphis cornu)]|nr:2,3-diphosphoglycerate-dependent phosphoglycerate mutase [Buchnera aphidicola (Hormaphis cornu)]